METDEVSWIEYFHSLPGHELMVPVDEDFIKDQFNLTDIRFGPCGMYAVIERITGLAPDGDEDPNTFDSDPLEVSAREVYGQIHARYILTAKGQYKLHTRFTKGEFGRCLRALCRGQPVVPIGLTEQLRQQSVKLFCPKCEDVYHPVPRAQTQLDGAYFGSTAAMMLFQTYPQDIPRRTNEQFVLKIYGFKLHEHAKLARWQQQQREELERRLRSAHQ